MRWKNMKKTQRFVIICIFIAVVQFVYTEKKNKYVKVILDLQKSKSCMYAIKSNETTTLTLDNYFYN